MNHSIRSEKETDQLIADLFNGRISFGQLANIIEAAFSRNAVATVDYLEQQITEKFSSLDENERRIIGNFVRDMQKAVNAANYQPSGDLLEKAANGTSGRSLDEIAADSM